MASRSNPIGYTALPQISYLANGGDYMKPLTRGHILAQSDSVIFNDIIDSLEHGALKGRKLKADDNPRMYLKK